MKQIKWRTWLFWILLAEGAGALAGWLTADGVKQFTQTAIQPSFAPPAVIFPIVWGILYGLMGSGAARVALSDGGKNRERALGIFLLQLIVNFFWSLFFFNLGAYGFSFLWILLLWVLILGTILLFRRVDPVAALLQIPYLLWVTFAAVLTYAIWMLNG